MATTSGRTEGMWLSIPRQDASSDMIVRVTGERIAYSDLLASPLFEFAVDLGMGAFVALGYDDAATVYATLYQIAPNGGLDWSECFPIDGPTA